MTDIIVNSYIFFIIFFSFTLCFRFVIFGILLFVGLFTEDLVRVWLGLVSSRSNTALESGNGRFALGGCCSIHAG